MQPQRCGINSFIQSNLPLADNKTIRAEHGTLLHFLVLDRHRRSEQILSVSFSPYLHSHYKYIAVTTASIFRHRFFFSNHCTQYIFNESVSLEM